MPDYTLFCAPDTYAMGAHAVLEETGAAYVVHWVELFADTPDPAFLAASPHCRTPALSGQDGTVFETGAVAMYIAERHPVAELVIPEGDPRRGRFLQWFHYLASTLQPEVLMLYHPEFHASDPVQQDALKTAAKARLSDIFTVLDEALSEGPYFFGDRPCIVDFLLGTQTIWDVLFADGIETYPAIARQRRALLARASVQRMLEQHRAESARRAAALA